MTLVEKKIEETKAELKEWLEKPNRKEQDYLRYLQNIKEELEEHKIQKSICLPFESLDNWYSNNFVYELLTKQATNYKTKAVANGYHIMLISDKLADQYINKNPPKLLFDYVSYWLSNCLSEKWYKESEVLIKIINKGLQTQFLSGGLNFKVSSWFILEISNKGFNKNIDLTQFNYPKDMGVYVEALQNWNTRDLKLLDNIVSILCDFHLKNATYGNQENDADIQFGDSAWFVYAYEILAWLSIREMIGLQNPEQFSHPLMHLAINKLPKEIIPMPKDELFEKVMERLNPPRASWSVFD